MVNVENGTVEFSFFRPEAQAVHIAGDFNNWRTDQLKMKRGQDGYWTCRLQLPAGVYKFRYYADGTWYTDYAAFGVDPGQFGMDSILNVRPPMLQVSRPREKQVAAA